MNTNHVLPKVRNLILVADDTFVFALQLEHNINFVAF